MLRLGRPAPGHGHGCARWRRQSAHAIIGIPRGERHRAQTLSPAQTAEHAQRPGQPASALDRARPEGFGSLPSQPALCVDGLSGRPVHGVSAGSRATAHRCTAGVRGALQSTAGHGVDLREQPPHHPAPDPVVLPRRCLSARQRGRTPAISFHLGMADRTGDPPVAHTAHRLSDPGSGERHYRLPGGAVAVALARGGPLEAAQGDPSRYS